MKSFSNWSIEEVENEFGLNPADESGLLDLWLTIELKPSHFEQSWLEYIRHRLETRSYTWNEQELIANFIAPLLTLVNFDHKSYRSFLERELSAPYGNETLSGEVDFVVAQGRYSPQRLFFFLHEYKKEHEGKDPRGQLLVAMIAAQLLNQDDNPIYGAYVIGHMWYFVVLEGKSYTVHHRGFNASSDEVIQIFGVLNNMKTIIDQLIDGKTNK